MGLGRPTERRQGALVYDVAAAAGDKREPEFRHRTAREMAPAEISMAHEFARERLDKHGE